MSVSVTPISSFEEAANKFPGLTNLEPRAVGRFAFYCAGNFPSELFEQEAQRANEWDLPARSEWEDKASRILVDIEAWRGFRSQQGHTTRMELTEKITTEVEHEMATNELAEQLSALDPNTAFESVTRYLKRWGYRPVMDMAASPLFPNGRQKATDLNAVIDTDTNAFDVPYGYKLIRDGSYPENSELDERLSQYIVEEYEVAIIKSKVNEVLGNLKPVDIEGLQMLRQLYGAKAASLIVFNKKLATIYQALGEARRQTIQVEVPDFTAVSTDMYDAWIQGLDTYTEMIEIAQQAALELTESRGDLIAIRSSAVNSEDSQEHTGAGIYKSTVVDPRDRTAFMAAIENVYQSVNSSIGISYREQCGIEDEKMGLVMQAYIEERDDHSRSAFGYINGRGPNPRLIEAHTPVGTLLFDREKVEANLLIAKGFGDNSLLHSTPDHSKELRRMPGAIIDAVHATVLAEQIFGVPMQIEYVAGGKVVQIRPLPLKAIEKHEEAVQFSETIETVAKTKAIGVGDLTLRELDSNQDNSDKKGFVVLWSEHRFTDNSWGVGSRSLPKTGAVIILKDSDSGHVQTLCQERGLLCFYPDSETERLDSLSKYLDDVHEGSREADEKQLTLRLVSNGYEGRIYEANAEESSSR